MAFIVLILLGFISSFAYGNGMNTISRGSRRLYAEFLIDDCPCSMSLDGEQWENREGWLDCMVQSFRTTFPEEADNWLALITEVRHPDLVDCGRLPTLGLIAETRSMPQPDPTASLVHKPETENDASPSFEPTSVPSLEPTTSEPSIEPTVQLTVNCIDQVTGYQKKEFTLLVGEYICSPNNEYHFGLSEDGNLSLWEGGIRIWSAGTYDCKTHLWFVRMQKDGNLVVRDDKGKAQWASHTPDVLFWRDWGKMSLGLGDDGIVTITGPTRGTVWTSERAPSSEPCV